MRLLLLLIFLTISSVTFSQNEYRLFLTYKEKSTEFPVPLNKTDQIYQIGKKDGVIVFYNDALRLVCNKTTEIYFNNEYVGEYVTEVTDCYTHIIVHFIEKNSYYFFFKIYSKDKSY